MNVLAHKRIGSFHHGVGRLVDWWVVIGFLFEDEARMICLFINRQNDNNVFLSFLLVRQSFYLFATCRRQQSNDAFFGWRVRGGVCLCGT